jgi:hypothetical protein
LYEHHLVEACHHIRPTYPIHDQASATETHHALQILYLPPTGGLNQRRGQTRPLWAVRFVTKKMVILVNRHLFTHQSGSNPQKLVDSDHLNSSLTRFPWSRRQFRENEIERGRLILTRAFCDRLAPSPRNSKAKKR